MNRIAVQALLVGCLLVATASGCFKWDKKEDKKGGGYDDYGGHGGGYGGHGGYGAPVVYMLPVVHDGGYGGGYGGHGGGGYGGGGYGGGYGGGGYGGYGGYGGGHGGYGGYGGYGGHGGGYGRSAEPDAEADAVAHHKVVHVSTPLVHHQQPVHAQHPAAAFHPAAPGAVHPVHHTYYKGKADADAAVDMMEQMMAPMMMQMN